MSSSTSSSRLERLLNILDSGSSQIIRSTAAKQLGEVVHSKWAELFPLLSKVVKLCFSKSWDTRIAAAHAIESIVMNGPNWPSFHSSFASNKEASNTSTISHASEQGEFSLHAAMEDISVYRDLKLAQVLLEEPELVVSAGQEYEVDTQQEKNMSVKERLAYQKRNLEKSIGGGLPSIGNSYMDYIKDTDLLVSDERPVSRNEVQLSAREKNQLKRKLKQEQQQHKLYQRQPKKSAGEKIKLASNTLDNPGLEMGINVTDDLKVPPKDGSWYLFKVVAYFSAHLTHTHWTVRHGASLGLCHLFKAIHAQQYRKPLTLEGYLEAGITADKIAQLNLWIQNLAYQCVYVLALDRFADYIGDKAHSPVRESVSTLLATLTQLTSVTHPMPIGLELGFLHSKLLPLLLQLAAGKPSVSKAEQRPPVPWQTKHGGFLGLKKISSHCFVSSEGRMTLDDLYCPKTEGDDLYLVLFEVCSSSLRSSEDEDVRLESAETCIILLDLFFIRIFTVNPNALYSFSLTLWTSLDGLDDFCASTSALISLLSHFYSRISLDPGLQRLLQDQTPEDQNLFVKLVQKLGYFIRHSSMLVRTSTLKALDSLLRLVDFSSSHNVSPSLLEPTLRLVFQNILIEDDPHLLSCSLSVWDLLIEKLESFFTTDKSFHRKCVDWALSLLFVPNTIPYPPSLFYWPEGKSISSTLDLGFKDSDMSLLVAGEAASDLSSLLKPHDWESECRILNKWMASQAVSSLILKQEGPFSDSDLDILFYWYFEKMRPCLVSGSFAFQRIVACWCLYFIHKMGNRNNKLLLVLGGSSWHSLRRIIYDDLLSGLSVDVTFIFEELKPTFSLLSNHLSPSLWTTILSRIHADPDSIVFPDCQSLVTMNMSTSASLSMFQAQVRTFISQLHPILERIKEDAVPSNESEVVIKTWDSFLGHWKVFSESSDKLLIRWMSCMAVSFVALLPDAANDDSCRLPNTLNPIIRPLMSYIKFESCSIHTDCFLRKMVSSSLCKLMFAIFSKQQQQQQQQSLSSPTSLLHLKILENALGLLQVQPSPYFSTFHVAVHGWQKEIEAAVQMSFSSGNFFSALLPMLIVWENATFETQISTHRTYVHWIWSLGWPESLGSILEPFFRSTLSTTATTTVSKLASGKSNLKAMTTSSVIGKPLEESNLGELKSMCNSVLEEPNVLLSSFPTIHKLFPLIHTLIDQFKNGQKLEEAFPGLWHSFVESKIHHQTPQDTPVQVIVSALLFIWTCMNGHPEFTSKMANSLFLEKCNESLNDLFLQLIGHSHALVRFWVASCIQSLTLTNASRSVDFGVLTILIEKYLPLMEHESALFRAGALELFYKLLLCHSSDSNPLISYVPFFVIPMLGRMSDSAEPIRLLAARCFSQLMQMCVLLDSSSSSSSQLTMAPEWPDAWKAKYQEHCLVLGQLLRPSTIDPFPCPIRLGGGAGAVDEKDSFQLRSYQQEGLSWLAFLYRTGLHGILCDDMGLGKTLQTLAMIASHYYLKRRDKKSPFASLIVCPTSLVGHWKEETIKWVGPYLKPHVHYGGKAKDRQMRLSSLLDHSPPDTADLLVITSYELLRNDIILFKDYSWSYVVLDEGHAIKNPKSQLSIATKQLSSAHRLLLSGTPVQNSIIELWSLFDWLMPGYLGSLSQFMKTYGRPILAARQSIGIALPSSTFSKGSARKTIVSTAEYKLAQKKIVEASSLALERLHQQTLPFLLRRMKEQVLSDLPPKIIQDVFCVMEGPQLVLYKAFVAYFSGSLKLETSKEIDPIDLLDDLDALEDHKNEPESKSIHIFQMLKILRKIATHPVLMLDEGSSSHGLMLKLVEQNARALGFAPSQSKHPISTSMIRNVFEEKASIAKINALKELLLNLDIHGASDQSLGGGGGSVGDSEFTNLLVANNNNNNPLQAEEELELNEEEDYCALKHDDMPLESSSNGGGGGGGSSVISRHRALIFCQSKRLLDLIEMDLLKKSFPACSYLRLDGDVPSLERSALAGRFNSDPSIDLFLLTTSVGGQGLTLTGANVVIFMECDWNPSKDLQAMDRAHRLGQSKTVQVFRLLTQDTIEDSLLCLQKFKLNVANTIITQQNASLSHMSTDEVLKLLEEPTSSNS